jgi:hypothetical protein
MSPVSISPKKAVVKAIAEGEVEIDIGALMGHVKVSETLLETT